MPEPVLKLTILAFVLCLLASSAGFVGATILLKEWAEKHSYSALLGAFALIIISNILYSHLLKLHFTNGYLLSAVTCLLGTLLAGWLIYGETVTWPRLAAGGCFLAGVGFLAFSATMEAR